MQWWPPTSVSSPAERPARCRPPRLRSGQPAPAAESCLCRVCGCVATGGGDSEVGRATQVRGLSVVDAVCIGRRVRSVGRHRHRHGRVVARFHERDDRHRGNRTLSARRPCSESPPCPLLLRSFLQLPSMPVLRPSRRRVPRGGTSAVSATTAGPSPGAACPARCSGMRAPRWHRIGCRRIAPVRRVPPRPCRASCRSGPTSSRRMCRLRRRCAQRARCRCLEARSDSRCRPSVRDVLRRRERIRQASPPAAPPTRAPISG